MTKCKYVPVKILEDNQGAIALSKNPVNRQRCKHVYIRFHFVRSALNDGNITIEYCPTAVSKWLISSLAISTLSIACSGEFSSDKTQQLFTIVSIVYLGFLWRLLSHPTAQHIQHF